MSAASSHKVSIDSAYHPVEAAIARLALGQKPSPGDELLDLWNDAQTLPSGTVHLEPSTDTWYGRDAVRASSDALARLVLAGFEGQLPVWLSKTADGDLLASRKPRSRRQKAVRAFPISLFKINWADSGPGISWPEHYHLGWLPGFDRWIVTGSRDTTDIDGYLDRVMGHFAHGEDPVRAACEVICDDWRHQYEKCDQGRWANVLEAGRVGHGEAEALADEVWAEPESEEESDEA